MTKKIKAARRRNVSTREVTPIITIEKAREAGYSASFLMTLSRTYERLAGKGYDGAVEGPNGSLLDASVSCFDRRRCLAASFEFRKMAREIGRTA